MDSRFRGNDIGDLSQTFLHQRFLNQNFFSISRNFQIPMRTKHTISLVLFLIAGCLLIWWATTGHQVWMSTQHQVQVRDDLFPDAAPTVQWEQRFTPGLEFIGPAAVLLVAAGVWFSMRSHKERMIVPTPSPFEGGLGLMTEDERLMHYDTLKKNAAVLYGMWLLFGWLGAHRTIEGRIWSGVVMFAISMIALFLYVIGDGLWGFYVLGAWWLLDLFLIGEWVRKYNEELIARLEGHII
jgi:hypothetical protein